MKKENSIILLAVLTVFVIYQFTKPILTEDTASDKAKEYVNLINEKKNSNFDTKKMADYSILNNDNVWNKIIGNRQWTVSIDGVAVYINAYTGEFVEMVFPLDGVINELPK
jgi:hypothetical protein